MLYRCRLLLNDGIVGEQFFREGSSVAEIRDALDMFQWPDGEWDIAEDFSE